MQLTPTLEKQVLARCCVDPQYREKARTTLEKGGCFGDATLAWVWKAISNLPRRDVVTRSALMAKAELSFQTEEEKEKAHVEIIDQIFELADPTTVATMATLDVLSQLASHATLESAVVEAAKLLDKGEVEQAWKRINNVRKLNSSSKSMRRIDYGATLADRVVQMRGHEGTQFEYIPTRIKGLDKYIDGVRMTEVFLVMATTNRGKSIVALNLAAASALQGFPTAIFSTEMLIDQEAMRFDSLLLKQEHRKFKTWSFTEEEEDQLASSMDMRIDQLAGKLFLFDTPIRKCRIEMVEDAVCELEEEIGEEIKMVVIDSPEHFESERKFEQKRHEASDVFWNLKSMARGEGSIGHPLALVATVQAPQEYEHKLAGTRAASESYDKSRIGDIIVTLNQTTEQEQNNEMIMYLAKHRDGEKHKQLLLRTHFKTMSFEEISEIDASRADLVKDLSD